MDHSPQRRTFLKAMAWILDGAIALALAIPAFRFVAEPLRRRRELRGFIRVGLLDSIPKGRPTRVVVSADRRDAYVHFLPGPVGQVWLSRETDSGGEPRVRCLQSICPHLGCGVEFVPGRDAFSCPCHASEFDRQGVRRFGPSPRDMDVLECRVGPADEDGRQWIEVGYVEFQPGVAEKRTIG